MSAPEATPPALEMGVRPSEPASEPRPLIGTALWAAVTVAIAALAGWFRLWNLGSAVLIPDSVFDLNLVRPGLAAIPERIQQTSNPACPIGFFLTLLGINLLGFNPLGACFASALSSTLTVFAVIVLGAVAGSRTAGLVAGLLLAFSTTSIYWAHQCRWWHAQPLMSVVLAITHLHWANRPSLSRLALHTVACVVALYTHAYCALIIASLWLGHLFSTARRRPRDFWRDGSLWALTAAVGLAALAFLPWLLYLRGAPTYYYPGRPFEADYVMGQVKQLLSIWQPGVFVPTLVLIGLGLVLAWWWNGALATLLLVTVLILPLGIAQLSEWLSIAFSARHLLFTLPFFLLAVGIAVASAARVPGLILRGPRMRAAALALGGLVVLLFVAGYARAHGWAHWVWIRNEYGKPGWVSVARGEIQRLAGSARGVVLVDHINVGSGLRQSLTIFGDPLAPDQMFPAWVFARPGDTSRFQQWPWETMLWVVTYNPNLLGPRLRQIAALRSGREATAIYEADPPMRTFEDFVEASSQVYRSVDEDFHRLDANAPPVRLADWFEAWLLWHAGRQDQARQIMTHALESAPNHPDVHLGMALMCVDQDRDMARMHIDQAIELAPGRQDLRDTRQRLLGEAAPAGSAEARARECLLASDWSGAATAAREALAANPRNGTAQGILAVALERQGDHSGAVQAWVAAVATVQGAEAPDLWQTARQQLSHEGMPLADALERGAADAWQARRVAQWLYDQRHFEESLAAWDLALRVGPPHAEFHLGRHRALMRLDRPRDALQAAQSAHECDPAHPWAEISIGDALWALGQHSEARDHWQRALDMPEGGDSRKQARSRLAEHTPP